MEAHKIIKLMENVHLYKPEEEKEITFANKIKYVSMETSRSFFSSFFGLILEVYEIFQSKKKEDAFYKNFSASLNPEKLNPEKPKKKHFYYPIDPLLPNLFAGPMMF